MNARVPHIQIIIGSIREGRVGRTGRPLVRPTLRPARRRHVRADRPARIGSTVPDNRHAAVTSYETEAQRRWAAKVDEADGYVLVTAE